MRRIFFGIVLASVAASAAAQLYRWTDEKGRVHVTDTPPPASAKSVQRKAAPRSGQRAGGDLDSQPLPYELGLAVKDFPVTLYTSPKCGDACTQARAALNKRGVPFKEIIVWDDKGLEELRKYSTGDSVPLLLVGRSVHEGFDPQAFDSLLDAARYPKAGAVPPRAQAAPPLPEEYLRRTAPPPPQQSAEPAEEPRPTGPYAPGAPPQQRRQIK